jgi:glucose/arabinose dehydrogenase
MRLIPAVTALAATLGLWQAGAAVADPVAGWPAGVMPRVPLNFRIQPYARGLEGASALLVLPNGDVLVAESRHGPVRSVERLTLLRDTAGTGTADQSFVLATDLPGVYGLALRRDRLFVAARDGLWSCPYLVGQTRLHGACRLQIAFDAAAGSGLAWHPDERHVLVAAGLANGPGGLYLATADGHELAPLPGAPARAIGLAFSPTTDELWTALPAATSAAKLVSVPAAAGAARAEVDLGAGASPRALLFYGRAHFPKLHRGGLFVATEREVVVASFADGRPTGAVDTVVDGFAADATATPYARPTALAVQTDGALLVADESTLWRVTFKCAACTPDPVPGRASPKPAARRQGPG